MDSLRYTQPGRIHGSDDGLMLKVISRFNDSIDLLWRKHSWKIPLFYDVELRSPNWKAYVEERETPD